MTILESTRSPFDSNGLLLIAFFVRDAGPITNISLFEDAQKWETNFDHKCIGWTGTIFLLEEVHMDWECLEKARHNPSVLAGSDPHFYLHVTHPRNNHYGSMYTKIQRVMLSNIIKHIGGNSPETKQSNVIRFGMGLSLPSGPTNVYLKTTVTVSFPWLSFLSSRLSDPKLSDLLPFWKRQWPPAMCRCATTTISPRSFFALQCWKPVDFGRRAPGKIPSGREASYLEHPANCAVPSCGFSSWA